MRPPVRIVSASRAWLRFLIPGALFAAVLSGGALAWVETETVSSYWDGLWRSLALVTTVGFVGPVPVTATGKIVSAGLMVLGFILIAMTTAAIASLFVREDEIPEEQRQNEFERAVLAELAFLRAELERLRNAPPGETCPASRSWQGFGLV